MTGGFPRPWNAADDGVAAPGDTVNAPWQLSPEQLSSLPIAA